MEMVTIPFGVDDAVNEKENSVKPPTPLNTNRVESCFNAFIMFTDQKQSDDYIYTDRVNEDGNSFS